MKQGSLNRIKIELDHIPKFDIDMGLNESINIFVGKNGSGKSFTMKLAWFLGHIMYSDALIKLEKAPSINNKDNVDYTLKFTFEEIETFTGTIEGFWSCGSELKIVLDKGVCKECDIKSEITEPVQPLYLSTKTRLFSDLDQYMSLRKRLAKDGELTPDSLRELLEDYKLPDLLYLEKRFNQLSSGLKVSEELCERLKKDFDFEFSAKMLYIEDNKSRLATEEKDIKLSSLGNGHQALINMYTSV